MKDFKKIMKYLKPYWLWALLGPIFMVVEVIMDLLIPRLLQVAVDSGIANGDNTLVIKSGLYMLLFSILAWFGGALCTYYATKASVSMGTDLREDLYKKVLKFSFDNLDRFPTGHLITRLTNDVKQIENIVLMALRVLVRVPLLIAGSLFMAYKTSPKLSIILVVSLPVLISSIVIVIKKAFPIYKEVQGNLDNVNKVAQENLSGMRAVKAFVRGEFENERFAKVNESLIEKMISAGKIIAFEMPFIFLVLYTSIFSVLYFGGHGVQEGTLAIGQIVAFISYLQMLLMSLMWFAMLLVHLSRSTVSIGRIGKLLDEEISIKDYFEDNLEIENGSVEFKDVSFNYGEDEDVLSNITFRAEKGEKIAILGSTGSGKSTLVHMLSRFYDVQKGSIEIDGIDIKKYPLKNLRKNIGLVLQNPMIFSGSIRDNITFGKKDASVDEIEEVAKIACCHDFIVDMEDGYETILGQKGVNLSGGQKQRVSIARCLLTKPKILVFDDSTSAVDAKTEGKIQEGLDRIMKGATTFIIAQRISSVLGADKILVMDKGKIVGMGTHEELLVSSEIYKEIYSSQLGGDIDA